MSHETKRKTFTFKLDPGIYKFDITEDDYKYDIHISKAKGYGGRSGAKKSVSTESMIVKLESSSTFHMIEHSEHYHAFTEDLYKIRKKLYFEDPKLSWIQVVDIYYEKLRAWNDHDINYYEENHAKEWYGRFTPVKGSKFTPFKDSNNYKFQSINIGQMETKSVPVEKILGLASLNYILIANKLKLAQICTTQYNYSELSKILGSHNKKNKKMLKVIDGLSYTDIVDTFKKHKDVVQKVLASNPELHA